MRTRANNSLFNLIIAVMTLILFFIVCTVKSEGVKPETKQKAKYNKHNVVERFKDVEFNQDSSYCAVSNGNGDSLNFRIIYLQN